MGLTHDRMDAAEESMREKIDVHVHDDRTVTLCIQGVHQIFSRNEFGELVSRLIHFDNLLGDAE